MTDLTPDRRAELIAAAVGDSLTADERAELDRSRVVDPAIDQEIGDLRQVVQRMRAASPKWDDAAPPADLRDRVGTIGAAGASGPLSASGPAGASGLADASGLVDAPAPTPLQRRGWVAALGAAACVLIGVGGTVGVQALGDARVAGPPGTLGAVETVEFTGEEPGVAIDGSLVAHTWGTETLLRVDGLPVDDIYAVTLVGTDGERFESGSFLGSTVTIDCRMNAAVPRTKVTGVEISDETGVVVASATLPDVV